MKRTKKAIQAYRRLDKADRTVFFLLFTTASNLVMAVVKLVLAFSLPSLWFFINAIFNGLLFVARAFSIRDWQRIRLARHPRQRQIIGFKNYLHNGVLLLFLGLSYFGVSVYVYYRGHKTHLHEYLTYLMALIAFVSVGTAIYGMVKYRKNQTPIIAALKVTSFANALTSIALTQAVLLGTFGPGFGTATSNAANTAISMLVSLAIIGLALFMIVGIQQYLPDRKIDEKSPLPPSENGQISLQKGPSGATRDNSIRAPKRR